MGFRFLNLQLPKPQAWSIDSLRMELYNLVSEIPHLKLMYLLEFYDFSGELVLVLIKKYIGNFGLTEGSIPFPRLQVDHLFIHY